MNATPDRPTLTVYFAWDEFLGLLTPTEEKWFYGGAEMQLQRLARIFAEAPDSSVVLLTEDRPPTIDIEGMTTRRMKPKLKRGLPLLGRLINQARARHSYQEASDHKILITSQRESFDAIERAKQTGVKVLYLVNGDSLIDGSKIVTPLAIGEALKRIEAADIVGVLTDHAERIVKERFDKPTLYVDSSIILPDQVATASHNDHVLWVGRNVPLKRPWEFLRLAKSLPQHQFVMVAPLGEPETTRLIAHDARGLDNLTYIEGMPWEELQELYATARVVVATSATEGLPNTLIEASAHGIGYVSLSLDFQGILDQFQSGFCAYDDFDRFVALVDDLMTDDALADRTGANARAAAEELWDGTGALERLASRVWELFE
ncbi:MAG: glycosyltransferase family 4 protein [Actinomycetia bacterium]|nr:glycosyltransferase family 4 protein [Actinomycetes bacterium]